MRCAPGSTSSTTTTHHLSAVDSRRVRRSRRSRTSWPASTTTPVSRRPSARRWCHRPIPTSGSTRRTSGRPAPGLTLNAGLRYDLQFLETISTDTNNSRRASASRGRRSTSTTHRGAGQRGALLRPRAAARAGQRAPVGRQHDRPGTCARQRQSFPAQAGAPVFPEHPERARAVGHAGQSHHDGPGYAKCLFTAGQPRNRAAARRATARSASAISICAA